MSRFEPHRNVCFADRTVGAPVERCIKVDKHRNDVVVELQPGRSIVPGTPALALLVVALLKVKVAVRKKAPPHCCRHIIVMAAPMQTRKAAIHYRTMERGMNLWFGYPVVGSYFCSHFRGVFTGAGGRGLFPPSFFGGGGNVHGSHGCSHGRPFLLRACFL